MSIPRYGAFAECKGDPAVSLAPVGCDRLWFISRRSAYEPVKSTGRCWCGCPPSHTPLQQPGCTSVDAGGTAEEEEMPWQLSGAMLAGYTNITQEKD